MHGSAPRYLQEVIRPVANVEPQRHLRSASWADLTVPATRRSTLVDRAFAVAGLRAWNTLPNAIQRCLTPDNFKRSLKTHLYIQSHFNAIISLCFIVTFVYCPRSDFYLRHFKLDFLNDYITFLAGAPKTVTDK